jgi:hypothetical protein
MTQPKKDSVQVASIRLRAVTTLRICVSLGPRAYRKPVRDAGFTIKNDLLRFQTSGGKRAIFGYDVAYTHRLGANSPSLTQERNHNPLLFLKHIKHPSSRRLSPDQCPLGLLPQSLHVIRHPTFPTLHLPYPLRLQVVGTYIPVTFSPI